VTPLTVAVLMLVATIVLVVIGVHISVALLSTAVGGLLLIIGDFERAVGVLGTGPFYAVFNYEFAVIPLFVLMGLFANASGASGDLYDAGSKVFGRVKGGLGIVTVLSNAIFAAVTGVSLASAAVFGKIAVPEMKRYGYSMRFSTGCVAGSSALGMLIPPSLLFIVYGLLSGESIGTMFIAGIVPGILLAGTFSVAILTMAYLRPRWLGNTTTPERLGWRDRLGAVGKASPIAGLILLVLGGIYAGVFTPTEAGAVGCIGALLLMILKGKFSLRNLQYALKETGMTTAAVFLLIIGAQIFSRMLTISGLVDAISHWVVALPLHPKLIMAMMMVILMLLGTFLDVTSILLIAMPIMLPVAGTLGLNLIWFGVMATICIETGLITPPFGMSVFVVKGAVGEGITVEDVFVGSFPFLMILLATIVILLFFPALSTWLPGLM
jgi:C4-dicarboxylate transporter, DctM subunit